MANNTLPERSKNAIVHRGMNQQVTNSILSRLPENELNTLLSAAEFVHLDTDEILLERNTDIGFAHFPETGLISMVAFVDSEVVEVATVGFEGFVGIPLVLGEQSHVGRVFCQIPGTGYNIPSEIFVALLPKCPTLFRLCLRYASCTFDQAGQNSACNRVHSIEERCAKWLLLSHNRMQADRFELTQKFLAQMLGVRRQSVSLAAGTLQQAGIIKYSRGHIEILNRKALEEVTCECYSVITTSLKKFSET